MSSPQPITQQPPTGFEVPTAYTGSNDNALGPASNEAAINYGVFMDRDAWTDRSTGPEMLNFIRAKTRSAMGTGEVYEALSLSSLNWNLKNDVNFQAEFFHPTANTLMETYKLFGVQNGEATFSDLDDAPFVLHHVARRAKFPNYWSSLDSLKTHRSAFCVTVLKFQSQCEQTADFCICCLGSLLCRKQRFGARKRRTLADYPTLRTRDTAANDQATQQKLAWSSHSLLATGAVRIVGFVSLLLRCLLNWRGRCLS